ncbi:MAG: SCO family protein [Flavobacteriales bacterium]
MVKRFWIVISSALLLFSCNEKENKSLPILGPYQVVDLVKDGQLVSDTSFIQVRPFSFWDQDSNLITQKDVEDKIYVCDFFFTSCPTICPKMKQQMLRIYEEFREEPRIVLLSHSIDPKRDSVARLKSFAEKLGIQSTNWHLLTGERDSIYSMAQHYMIAAQEDDLAPGGFAHSGAFLLVDRNRQIRGIYNGTDPEDVDQLMIDMRTLLSTWDSVK